MNIRGTSVKNMTLTNIAAACNGKLHGLNSNENKKYLA